MSSGVLKRYSGQYTGTGVAFDITLDFTPRVVTIRNITDLVISMKNSADPDANHTTISNHDTTQIALVTTNGITIGTQKITIGTDASINTASSICRIVAEE